MIKYTLIALLGFIILAFGSAYIAVQVLSVNAKKNYEGKH